MVSHLVNHDPKVLPFRILGYIYIVVLAFNFSLLGFPFILQLLIAALFSFLLLVIYFLPYKNLLSIITMAIGRRVVLTVTLFLIICFDQYFSNHPLLFSLNDTRLVLLKDLLVAYGYLYFNSGILGLINKATIMDTLSVIKPQAVNQGIDNFIKVKELILKEMSNVSERVQYEAFRNFKVKITLENPCFNEKYLVIRDAPLDLSNAVANILPDLRSSLVFDQGTVENLCKKKAWYGMTPLAQSHMAFCELVHSLKFRADMPLFSNSSKLTFLAHDVSTPLTLKNFGGLLGHRENELKAAVQVMMLKDKEFVAHAKATRVDVAAAGGDFMITAIQKYIENKGYLGEHKMLRPNPDLTKNLFLDKSDIISYNDWLKRAGNNLRVISNQFEEASRKGYSYPHLTHLGCIELPLIANETQILEFEKDLYKTYDDLKPSLYPHMDVIIYPSVREEDLD